jgi:hypothetical protein
MVNFARLLLQPPPRRAVGSLMPVMVQINGRHPAHQFVAAEWMINGNEALSLFSSRPI